MQIFFRFCFIVFLSFFGSCTTVHIPYPEEPYPYPPDERRDRDRDEDWRKEEDKEYLERLGIPKGHLPPPGECKIWYPDSPAGQQPPPESCRNAFRYAGRDTWILERINPREVVVHFYDRGYLTSQVYIVE